jgi:hypothetical protein
VNLTLRAIWSSTSPTFVVRGALGSIYIVCLAMLAMLKSRTQDESAESWATYR